MEKKSNLFKALDELIALIHKCVVYVCWNRIQTNRKKHKIWIQSGFWLNETWIWLDYSNEKMKSLYT